MGDGSSLGQSRLDTKGKGRATPQNGDILALDLHSAEEGTGGQNGDAFMQMQLVEQQVRLPFVYQPLSHILRLPRERRTATSKPVPQPSSLSSRPLQSSARYSHNLHRWWPSSEKLCNVSTQTRSTLLRTSAVPSGSCSSTTPVSQATDGSC